MLAFHGQLEIKQFYMDRVRRHREADELIQGTGWRKGRGCAVGCTLEEYDHEKYPTQLGVPKKLAYLQDILFEGLPAEDAIFFPEQFLGAISVGADLSLVWPRFALWVLEDQEHGVPRFITDPEFEQLREAGRKIADLHRAWVNERVPLTQGHSEVAAIEILSSTMRRWGQAEKTVEAMGKAEEGRWVIEVVRAIAESAWRWGAVALVVGAMVQLMRRKGACVRWKLAARDTLLKLLAEAPVA